LKTSTVFCERIGRIVQLTEITERALADHPPLEWSPPETSIVLLAIFEPLMLAKKHLGRRMSLETPRFKMAGLHYITLRFLLGG
jgi:hypothetical protein